MPCVPAQPLTGHKAESAIDVHLALKRKRWSKPVAGAAVQMTMLLCNADSSLLALLAC
jgi:hypothetical protein